MHQLSVWPCCVTKTVISLPLQEFLELQLDRQGSPCVVCSLFLRTFHGAQGGGNSHGCFGFGQRLHNDAGDFEIVQELGLANLVPQSTVRYKVRCPMPVFLVYPWQPAYVTFCSKSTSMQVTRNSCCKVLVG